MSALAVLIDTWQTPLVTKNSTAYENVLANICNFCLGHTDITAIALAPFSADPTCDAIYDAAWISDSQLWFADETKWDSLRRHWKSIRWQTNGIHAVISNMATRHDQTRFTLTTDHQLIYYCQFVNPSIDTIYVMGFEWNQCVKYRPVGWLQILSLQYHNLIDPAIRLRTKADCVFDLYLDSIAQPELPWLCVDPQQDIYELDPTQVQW